MRECEGLEMSAGEVEPGPGLLERTTRLVKPPLSVFSWLVLERDYGRCLQCRECHNCLTQERRSGRCESAACSFVISVHKLGGRLRTHVVLA